jgi:enediyne biosynthesis protein E3
LGHRYRALRRRILTPGLSATRADVRGFHRKDEQSTQLLEKVGRTFLSGYGSAAEARTIAEAEEALEQIPPRFRGFAYEGAGMGFAVRDGLPLGPTSLVERFLAGPGEPHIYMVYVGVGWAMARLPRFRWPRADRLDPTLHWLLLDGYGFHQAYFHTQKYVHQHHQDQRFPWPSRETSAYANRVIDQGIGRALWFVCGSDAQLAATTVDSFASHRRADLYSGIGLAATYAGGVTEEELRKLWELAGPYRQHLAQGSAFAAECRVRAGLLTPHTGLATAVLCGCSPEAAAQVTKDHRPEPAEETTTPAYELWRSRIAAAFAPYAEAGVPATVADVQGRSA